MCNDYLRQLKLIPNDMINAKDYLKETFPKVNTELETMLFRNIVTNIMELYAIEVASDLVNNCNTPAVSVSVCPDCNG